MPKLACVAGEPSGDLLAAPVLHALHQMPEMASLSAYGVGGPLMRAEGFDSRWPMEILFGRRAKAALYGHSNDPFCVAIDLGLARRPD